LCTHVLIIFLLSYKELVDLEDFSPQHNVIGMYILFGN